MRPAPDVVRLRPYVDYRGPRERRAGDYLAGLRIAAALDGFAAYVRALGERYPRKAKGARNGSPR